jgi:NAD dependent epimerase/dehydratase family enzyme/ligand-binding SRPBCC domain-containing protein
MREGAFWRLAPSWEEMEFIEGPPVPYEGSLLRFKVKQGPLFIEWRARHVDFIPGREFTDIQEKGPFAQWKHVHKITDENGGRSILEDCVDYRLPFALDINPLARHVISSKVEQMFEYRHAILLHDLQYFSKYKSVSRKKILVAGADAPLGAQLVAFLRTQGHQVLVLTPRMNLAEQPGFLFLNLSDLDNKDGTVLNTFDAIIDLRTETALHGDGYGNGSLSEGLIFSSASLVSFVQRYAPHAVLISLSSAEIYGKSGLEKVDESTAPAADERAQFLARLERTFAEAARDGCRVVNLRMGQIISTKNGLLKQLLSSYHPGSAIEIASRSTISWVAFCDAIYAIYHALMNDKVRGTVNVAAPGPITANEFAHILNSIVMPHSLLTMPATHRTLDELNRDDCFLVSTKLVESGFSFAFADLETALRHLVGKTHGAAQSLYESI